MNVQEVRDSIKDDINRLERAYDLLGQVTFVGAFVDHRSTSNGRKATRSGPRRMSASARKRIAAAQRARWAKWKLKNKKAA